MSSIGASVPTNHPPPPVTTVGTMYTYVRGQKYYELTDQKGNVISVVTDKKIQHSSNGTTVDYYLPDVVSATDYYPFGMEQPGRTYNAEKYRYGFNGKEKDPNISKDDYDYGMRIYDARIARFLSVDPLTKTYPFYTPYQFAGNKPIIAVDLDGKEEKIIINWFDAKGNNMRTKIVTPNFKDISPLYNSLITGLNPNTTYDIEGVKFNSTNGQFTSGFDTYKKAAYIVFKPATVNNNGNVTHPSVTYAPTVGTLTINAYANGTVGIDYTKPTPREQLASDLGSWSTLTGATGNILQGAGALLTVTGTPEAGVPLLSWGKGLSTVSTYTDAGSDALLGKYKSAGIKTGIGIGSDLIGGQMSKALTKGASDATKKVVGYAVGQATDKDGEAVKSATMPTPETSNTLNYSIQKDPPKQ